MRCEEFESIEPPTVTKLAGRPKKKRIRTANEPNKTYGKLSKRGQKQKCGICKQQGHNRVNCPNKGNQVIFETFLVKKLH